MIRNIGDIEYDPSFQGIRDIIDLIEGVGYEAELKRKDVVAIDFEARELKMYWQDFIWALVFVVPTFIISMVFTVCNFRS